jgi:protein-S-isoprenylcysteine O-methyltransferase Ste14
MEQSPRRIDVGRVVAVSFFVLMLVVTGARLAADGFADPLSALASLLTMAFYLLLVFAYLRRSPSSRTDHRWGSWLVAFLGTGAPFAIPLVSNGPSQGAVATAAALVLAVGLAAMLWALGALGTNISVVPQARAIVTSGPYSRVRHPLYAAELLNVIGLCLASTGPWPWVVLVALAAFQVQRARREEALLAVELPGYAEYKSRTPMLVPALGRS